MIGELTYHKKCGLPFDLCVCGGLWDPKIQFVCRCLFCGEDLMAVVPPGFTEDRIQCPECLKIGFVTTELAPDE